MTDTQAGTQQSPTLRLGGNYRPEIDGLRAVSILCVVIFHLKLTAFQGGYVGVDVFFVISGYLITRNIVGDLYSGAFSLKRFYARRIRRLFPALFFMLAAAFVAAAVCFSPELMRSQARDTIVALASVSNILFWRDAHLYFAPDVESVPLLHTWSLAVEEQFYLFWSIGLLVAGWSKARTFVIPFAILAVGAASLLLSQYWLSRDAAAAFYLMPARIFELSIGALCVWLERLPPRHAVFDELLFLAGLGAILGAALGFGPATPFPGVSALVPCLGAAMIIYSGARARSAVLLNNAPAVGIGLISYSLYLCHWPIFFFAGYLFGNVQSVAAKLALAAISFAVATGMYHFIEKPFRHRSATVTARDFSRLLVYCAALTLVLLVPAALALRQDGWSWRLSPSQRELARLQSLGSLPCPPIQKRCFFGDVKGPLAVQLLGDSFAHHLIAVFQPLLAANGLKGEAITTGGCPLLLGLRIADGSGTSDCRNERPRALEAVRRSNAPLVIGDSWFIYRDGELADEDGRVLPLKSPADRVAVFRAALERTIAEFGGGGRHILIFGAFPFNECKIQSYRLQPGPLGRTPIGACAPLAAEQVRAGMATFDRMLLDLQREHAGSVSVLLPIDYVCDTNCPIERNGLWLYFDDNGHLTVAGAEYLSARAKDALNRFLRPGQAPTAR